MGKAMKRSGISILTAFVISLFYAALLSACASGTTKHATSVVDYLFPKTKDPIVTPGIPVLSLPLRVGIAFVPPPAGRDLRSGRLSSGFTPFQGGGDLALTEKRKTDLMLEVAKNFKKYPFVKNIEIIPSAYLTPGGSFANLDQMRTMLELDVIVLLSYDQVQFTDQTLSFTYWTMAGPLVVPAQNNDTHTMLDAVVYDIASRKMLFRAPGTSLINGSSMLVDQSQELRADGDRGFSEAAVSMISNLDGQLALFKEKLKERPEEFQVVRTPAYIARSGGGGGGSLDSVMLLLFIGLGAGFLWLKGRR
jgi:rhombotail lipoprotein